MRRKRVGVIWLAALFFAAGYVVALGLRNTAAAERAPTVATTLAVAATIVLAGRTRRLLGGALRGLGIGMGTGAGILMAVVTVQQPDVAQADVVSTAVAVGTMVAVASASGPGLMPAGQVALALAAPTARQHAAPVGIESLSTMAMLLPALCCCIVGAVFGLLGEWRQRRIDGHI